MSERHMTFACVICLRRFKPRWFSQVACGGKCLGRVQYLASVGHPVVRPWSEQVALWESNKRFCKTCDLEIGIMREVHSPYCSKPCQRSRRRPRPSKIYPRTPEQKARKKELDRRYGIRLRAIVRAALELGLIKEI